MKTTVLKKKGSRESLVREDLEKIVEMIASGCYIDEVHRLRELYPPPNPLPQDDRRPTAVGLQCAPAIAAPVLSGRHTAGERPAPDAPEPRAEQGRRYWLSDEEISRLISENERFQRIDSLSEMIAETFRAPDDDDQAVWWSNSQILDCLKERFGKTTLNKVTPEKIGNVLSRSGFTFKSKHTNAGTKYLLVLR